MNKENRKVVCADCLLISYKFNQLCEVGSAESCELGRIVNDRKGRVECDFR